LFFCNTAWFLPRLGSAQNKEGEIDARQNTLPRGLCFSSLLPMNEGSLQLRRLMGSRTGHV